MRKAAAWWLQAAANIVNGSNPRPRNLLCARVSDGRCRLRELRGAPENMAPFSSTVVCHGCAGEGSGQRRSKAAFKSAAMAGASRDSMSRRGIM